jgi:hypothetical protein
VARSASVTDSRSRLAVEGELGVEAVVRVGAAGAVRVAPAVGSACRVAAIIVSTETVVRATGGVVSGSKNSHERTANAKIKIAIQPCRVFIRPPVNA